MEEVDGFHQGITMSGSSDQNSLWAKLYEAKQQRRLELAKLPFEKKVEIVRLLRKMAEGCAGSRKRR